MFKKFFPCAYAKDVFSIDYKKLKDKGYKAVLFDIDNTLVHHNSDTTPEIEELFKDLKELGIKTVLVSNNDEPRVKRFLTNIASPYVCDAEKPDVKAYKKALELIDASASEAVFVGDQMFIDIYGANKANIDSIMVHFIVVDPGERIGIRRHIENFILFFYRLCKRSHKLDDFVIKR